MKNLDLLTRKYQQIKIFIKIAEKEILSLNESKSFRQLTKHETYLLDMCVGDLKRANKWIEEFTQIKKESEKE